MNKDFFKYYTSACSCKPRTIEKSPVNPGSSLDWVYDSASVPFSFVLEIAGDLNGTNRFLLTEDKIEMTDREMFAGVDAMMREIHDLRRDQRSKGEDLDLDMGDDGADDDDIYAFKVKGEEGEEGEDEDSWDD